MPKKMLFNATEPEELRAAIVEDNVLLEYDLEARSREQNRNNIYRGYVVQIESSIQAAFVEYGTGRHGFLPFREIHPDFYTRPPKQGERYPSIDQVIKKGQQVVVQVVREEVDHKGAALTTYCTLPGRYLVLMPRSDNSGISRKIEESEERQALREIMRNIKPPEGFGYIVRTAGLGKSEGEISRDLDIMVRLWYSIQKAAKRGPRSGLIFQEADIVQRMIRDYYESDVDEIWIDDFEAFERAHTYFSAVMPNSENVVKFYEGDIPLFAHYKLEDQINQIYARQVPLPSGGSIVIDTTEALVAIDVNSGKTQSDKTEDTAYKTNCEAAVEIAKQLRMRDLGGLIVIDFIGMRLTRHMRGVERTMHDAIKDDKARMRIGRITSIFGLLTLSRQRIRDKKELTHFTSCPACRGTGKYPNVETSALKAYRHLQKLVAEEKYDRISASLPKEVALYLLNYKRKQITAIEQEFEVQISIMPKESITLDLERDISVQIRSRESQRKRKQRTPIELPYERLSIQATRDDDKTPDHNDRIELPERSERNDRSERSDRSERNDRSDRSDRSDRYDRSERNDRSDRSERNDRSDRSDRSERNDRYDRSERNDRSDRRVRTAETSDTDRISTSEAQDMPSIVLPDPNEGPDTYYEDGWDRVAQERISASYPLGSPWFLRHMKEDRSGPSIGQMAREHGLVRPRRQRTQSTTPPQEARPVLSATASPVPAVRQESQATAVREHPREARRELPQTAEPERRRRPREEVQEETTAQAPTQTPAPASAPVQVEQPAPLVASEEEATPAITSEVTPPPTAVASPVEVAVQRDGGEESSQEDLLRRPLPAEIVAQHNAKSKPEPQRPAAKPISYRPAPYHPMNPPKAQKPAEGGVWSNNELERIRRAAEDEQRRMTRWDRQNPGESNRPTGVEELRNMAHALSPETKEVEVTVTVTPPHQETNEEQRTILKRPARRELSPAFDNQNGHGKPEVTESPKVEDSGKRNRWSDEEVDLLQSLCHLPLQEAKAAFEAKGYDRSLNAFRNRYYSLRSQ